MSFGGKNMKREREKEEKWKTRKEKGERRKKKRKRSKRVKEVQSSEELRHIGHDRSKKTWCRERGKNVIFGNGRGKINIIFRPQYRPLNNKHYPLII
jgi:hypothetical protein